MISSNTQALREAEKLLKYQRPEQAILVLESYCENNPFNAQGWFLLGAAYHQAGNPEAAIHSLERAISINPQHIQARSVKAAALCDLGLEREALQVYRKALHLAPQDAQLLVNIGVVMERMGDISCALERYTCALKSQPDFASALLNRGAVLLMLDRREEALVNNRRLVELMPDWDSAQYNYGEALLTLGRWEEALAAYELALSITPVFAKALFSKGLALSMLRRFDDAQHAFDSAKMIDPAVVESCIRSATVLTDTELREFTPKVIYLYILSQRQENCDWSKREEFVNDFERLIESSLGQPDEITERSLVFRSLSLPISAESRLILSRSVSARIADSINAKYPSPFVHQPLQGSRKLKIGYVSPDFRIHPVAFLTRNLYKTHDRSKFEVYGYSLHPSDGSELRRDIEQGCDHFRELSALSAIEAAETIFADGVDLLVDLSGYTAYTRTEILALRPAPIQVEFLGFPHTMGSSFIQYYIADSVVSPPGFEDLFMEKIVYMPSSYFMLDNSREPPELQLTRVECGLPVEGFVFCCFNNSNKIEPGVFDVWMNLLKRVTGSVLWLYLGSDEAVRNLQREAELRGVSSSRLIFAPRVRNDRHVARYRLADLFLDTFLYNGHTTAIEALWAGLPVLTYPGQIMPSRVAASLLISAGLEEMIAKSPQEYEEIAYSLATKKNALSLVRDKLARNRKTSPLFDTVRQVRNLEMAYQIMWHKHVAGLPPESFHVVD